jgi:serine beta-lactamase-like protein LACTB
MPNTRRFPLRTLLAAAAVAATALLHAAPSSSRDSAQSDVEAIARARAIAEGLAKTHHIPGLSVAVGRGGRVVWSEGFGLADVEQRVPVTSQTRFRLGSVSKLLTAAAVARLVQDDKLDLDAPVQRYVPSFPQKQWPVTTRQLAAHTGGIRHYTGADFSGPLAGAPAFDDVAASLALFAGDPLLFEPGTKYAYSTYGWSLISAVVEGASGRPFLEYLQEAVFEPLAMRSTGGDHLRAIVPNRTRFYETDAQGKLRHAGHVDNSYKWAGGGLLSTPEDLVRFTSAHFQPGFYTPQAIELLFTPRWEWPGGNWQVGLGWRVGVDAQGRRVYHHGGTIDGGRAMVMAYPESQVVVVMLANVLARFGEPEAQAIGALFARGGG